MSHTNKEKLIIAAVFIWMLLIVVVAAFSQTPHSITLSWSNPLATNVYRAAASGGPYTLQTSLPVGTSTWKDPTAVAGTPYFYVVTALDANGNESVNSAEVAATMPTNPNAPSGLTATVK